MVRLGASLIVRKYNFASQTETLAILSRKSQGKKSFSNISMRSSKFHLSVQAEAANYFIKGDFDQAPINSIRD